MDKKKKNASGLALYGAIFVCLLAVGAGGWRLLQRGDTRKDAQTRTTAVSGPAQVPETRQNTTPDEPDESDLAPTSGTSDAADTLTNVRTSAAADTSSAANDTASDTSVTASDTSGGAATTISGTTSNTTSNTGKSSSNTGKSSSNTGKTSNATSNTGKSASNTDKSTSDTTGNSSGNTTVSAADESVTDVSGETVTDVSNETAPGVSGETVPGVSGESVPGTAGETVVGVSDDGGVITLSDSAGEIRLTVEPLAGETLTAFAMEELLYNDTLRDWRTHDGVDIAADYGAQVLAVSAGTVVSVTDDLLMGTTVVIRHDGDWETVYACMENAADVEAGEEVSAGQVIGFVGDASGAEAAVGPHLHFSVLDGGIAVDPETFLHPTADS